MNKDTSWNKVSKWYNKSVGEKGNYFHQTVVIPGVVRLLRLGKESKVLDIACGQGVLARHIPKDIKYCGVDMGKDLIETARKLDNNILHKYVVANVTEKLPVEETFDKVALILALQNIKEPHKTIKLITEKMDKNGELVIVMNHPYFRIPRQTSWGIDETNKIQYRRVDKYMSSMEIPMTMHPGMKNSAVTWSYHRPLSSYISMMAENGLLIERIEEWVSDKESVGKAAKMENRAREEFPMFMAILAVKK